MTTAERTRRNANQIKDGSAAATAVLYVFAVLICIITLYPMYYVVIKSISDPQIALTHPVLFYPQGLYFGSYSLILRDKDMWIAYGNTLIYVASTTILMILTSVTAAYPLVNNKLAGRKFLVAYLLIPMYFGGGMIPSFLLINRLGLYNTRLALIIPGAVGIWNIILTRTYFASLPGELSEAAFIDGANNYQVLFRIFIPLAKPIIAVIAIYTIVGVWNSWFGANIYQTNTKLHPLQMYLQRVLISQSVDLNKLKTKEEIEEAYQVALGAQQLKYAMIVFITLPILFIYPLFQKQFMKGIMLGSLKG